MRMIQNTAKLFTLVKVANDNRSCYWPGLVNAWHPKRRRPGSRVIGQYPAPAFSMDKSKVMLFLLLTGPFLCDLSQPTCHTLLWRLHRLCCARKRCCSQVRYFFFVWNRFCKVVFTNQLQLVTKWLVEMVTKKMGWVRYRTFRGVWLQSIVKSWYGISLKWLRFSVKAVGKCSFRKLQTLQF